MILIVYILNNLPIADREVSLRDIRFIPLIESVPELRDHRHADGFVIRCTVLQFFRLPPILPRNDSYSQYTNLLNPVFLYRLHNHLPVQRRPLLHYYT